MRISDWSSDVCSSDLDVGDEGFEKLLLFIEDGVGVARLFGIGEPGRRPHRAELRLQHIVVGARRIERDIDADRLRAHLVEIAERVREQGAVERRTDTRVEKRFVIIGYESDAAVLLEDRKSTRLNSSH